MQTQRRRYVLITKWGEFMKDLDMFIGAPGGRRRRRTRRRDIRARSCRTSSTCRSSRVGGRRRADAPAPPPLNPQPICGVITGALYNDDVILSVAHQFQVHNDVVNRHPKLA